MTHTNVPGLGYTQNLGGDSHPELLWSWELHGGGVLQLLTFYCKEQAQSVYELLPSCPFSISFVSRS